MRIIYDLPGLTRGAILLGYVSCGAVVLAQFFASLGVMIYHPHRLWTAIVPINAAIFLILSAACWLFASRSDRSRLTGFRKYLAGLLGTLVTAFGAYYLMLTWGAWIVSFWPFLLGLSLLILAAEAFFPDPEVN